MEKMTISNISTAYTCLLHDFTAMGMLNILLCVPKTFLKCRSLNTYTRLTAPFSVTTRVSRYQKGKTNLDFTEARDSEWQWHQMGHMQVCTSLQTDNHASTPTSQFFTGRMSFLAPNQQRQSTEGRKCRS